MIKLLKSIVVLALFSTVAVSATTSLNLNGKLYTQQEVINAPVTVTWETGRDVPWIEPGYTILNPVNGNLTVRMELAGLFWTEGDDADAPEWPGLVLYDGDAFSLDFVVVDPLPDVWRLGISGPITDGNVQLFMDLYDGRTVGLAGSPVPGGILPSCEVPEPQHYAMIAGLGMLLAAFVKRRRQ